MSADVSSHSCAALPITSLTDYYSEIFFSHYFFQEPTTKAANQHEEARMALQQTLQSLKNDPDFAANPRDRSGFVAWHELLQEAEGQEQADLSHRLPRIQRRLFATGDTTTRETNDVVRPGRRGRPPSA